MPVITADMLADDIRSESFEPTVKFKKPVKSQREEAAVKELHITELLRREGLRRRHPPRWVRVGKLAAAATGVRDHLRFGGVRRLLVAVFPPDERPLAEVQFDERAQARGASSAPKAS